MMHPCRSISPTKNSRPPRPRAARSRIRKAKRARKMENPTTRGPVENAAKRYAALAEKLEAARRAG